MTSENEINIKGLYSLYPNILDILLRDNTTKKNIIWATVHYQNKGLGYSITDEIKPCHLNGMAVASHPNTEMIISIIALLLLMTMNIILLLIYLYEKYTFIKQE